ncbi:MAG: hypothetical protein ABIT20_11730 [Gemmatimonadaceae bacterium]
MTRLPQYSTPDVDAYHISFQNQRAGSRIYGMLAMPSKPGKYPVMLVVPGAGVRPCFPGDFLFSLPQADSAHYAGQGGSQGGGLSIIVGALDPRQGDRRRASRHVRSIRLLP